MTTPSNKAFILGELWINYRQDEEFVDFIEYNDIGLPLAYMVSNNIVETNPMAQGFIDETFDLLLKGLGIEDEDFESLEEILQEGLTDI
jgi:hypothetical protein